MSREPAPCLVKSHRIGTTVTPGRQYAQQMEMARQMGFDIAAKVGAEGAMTCQFPVTDQSSHQEVPMTLYVSASSGLLSRSR